MASLIVPGLLLIIARSTELAPVTVEPHEMMLPPMMMLGRYLPYTAGGEGVL